ncbi:MAG: sulfate transporter [Hyphomicrobiaceae bacterium]|nr:MAG: sulfate transporter [Hyphomicrobiaceae bacterium]
MISRSLKVMAWALLLGLVAQQQAYSQTPSGKYIIVQSTTSTENSGLFKHLLPKFTAKTGIEVRVVAVGTGQAIKNAQKGDGDVLFVHDTPSEDKFVAEGFGVRRFPVMYNDFVVIGPAKDPAGIAGSKDVAAAFKKIAEAKAPFVSRGDDSGTHKAELRLWQAAGVDAKAASGGWYREAGSGMGATINTGVGMGAYVFTDRATWSSFKNRGDYKIAVEADKKLFNQYGVILINPAKHPNVKKAEGQAFVDWLISGEGQNAIRSFQINGEQQFFPNANVSG